MSKNAWITLISIVVVLVSLALVLMLILVPQSKSYITGVAYDNIEKNDFKYEDTKYDPQKEENWEMHETNSSQIRNGQVKGYYEPGNINPFTPKGEVTIYNEPGYNPGTTTNGGSTNGNGSTSGNGSGQTGK